MAAAEFYTKNLLSGGTAKQLERRAGGRKKRAPKRLAAEQAPSQDLTRTQEPLTDELVENLSYLCDHLEDDGDHQNVRSREIAAALQKVLAVARTRLWQLSE